MFLFALDLDRLDELSALRLLRVNEPGIFSFHDRDHLKFMPGSNRERRSGQRSTTADSLREHLKSELGGAEVSRIILVSNLRMLGYVFNPVSFYYLYTPSRRGEELCAVLAEVNNTFGEQKHYLIRNTANRPPTKKSFYISPFISHDADFQFLLKAPDENLFVRIDSTVKGELQLRAVVSGRRSAISDAELARCLFRYPLYTLMVIVLIHWQAMKLFIKRVPFFSKADTDKKITESLHSEKRGADAYNT